MKYYKWLSTDFTGVIVSDEYRARCSIAVISNEIDMDSDFVSLSFDTLSHSSLILRDVENENTKTPSVPENSLEQIFKIVGVLNLQNSRKKF